MLHEPETDADVSEQQLANEPYVEPLLELKEVSRVYGSGDAKVYALRDVSLRIMPGDFVSIVGPSGSGKSTMLGLLGCLDIPTSGTIIVGGKTVTGLDDADRTEVRAIESLDKVGLGHRHEHRPVQMSGGEQQRVALARALVTEPKILLADEPTGALDSQNAENVMELLTNLQSSERAVVLVTHAAEVADAAFRKVSMRDGRIVSDMTRVR